MAKFMGIVHGAKGEASRLGTAKSGMETTAASYEGCVKTRLWVQDDEIHVSIWFDTWKGGGEYKPIYRGPINPTHRQLSDRLMQTAMRAEESK